MMGYVLAAFVDLLTGAGLVEQQESFLGKLALHVCVFGILLVRTSSDLDKYKGLIDEATFYDKQWNATWDGVRRPSEAAEKSWHVDTEIIDDLPVPDWAWAITSRPCTIGSTARCWMADGFSKPAGCPQTDKKQQGKQSGQMAPGGAHGAVQRRCNVVVWSEAELELLLALEPLLERSSSLSLTLSRTATDAMPQPRMQALLNRSRCGAFKASRPAGCSRSVVVPRATAETVEKQERKPGPLARGGTLSGDAAAGKDAGEKARVAVTGAAPAVATYLAIVDGRFRDDRWIEGRWDLSQFKDSTGEVDWDKVIDIEIARRKLLEDNPIPSINEEPVNFDTSEIPWWAWVKRFHLPEVSGAERTVASTGRAPGAGLGALWGPSGMRQCGARGDEAQRRPRLSLPQ
ncbi:hypothetical protein TSOC_011259 [Tetrabaena socialis]|uniref:Uncharacterized protein n=1 Tax=Tetrabaena socialis TaxID=47790 RepID=A0A2J7ZR32_9CHLO|nr:hypothetical protein TSOC_011259 [Tetrabaena socialis]|eukprot:PNH02733.1 hypothetical protein TSOC_011259 [Tetrabaena socialis]